MSAANYDSSDVTRFRKARALYAFKHSNTAAVNNNQSVLPSQGPPLIDPPRINANIGAGTVWRDGCAIHAGCATNCPSAIPITNCQGAPAATGGI